MRILYNAIECKERAIAGGDRIIITYNKETSTRCRIASLRGGKSHLQSFGLFREPEVVGPYGAQALTQGCFDLAGFLISKVLMRK